VRRLVARAASLATAKGRRTRLARRLARRFQSVASPVRWNVVASAFCSRAPRIFHSSARVVVRGSAVRDGSRQRSLGRRSFCSRAGFEIRRSDVRSVSFRGPCGDVRCGAVRRRARRRRDATHAARYNSGPRDQTRHGPSRPVGPSTRTKDGWKAAAVVSEWVEERYWVREQDGGIELLSGESRRSGHSVRVLRSPRSLRQNVSDARCSRALPGYTVIAHLSRNATRRSGTRVLLAFAFPPLYTVLARSLASLVRDAHALVSRGAARFPIDDGDRRRADRRAHLTCVTDFRSQPRIFAIDRPRQSDSAGCSLRNYVATCATWTRGENPVNESCLTSVRPAATRL